MHQLDPAARPVPLKIELPVLAAANRPFAHVVRDDFLAPGLLAELARSFPDMIEGDSPTGFALFRGDSGYDELLTREPAWRLLHDSFQSQGFIDWAARQFLQTWQDGGCTLDLTACSYVDYIEDREDKPRRQLRNILLEPHQLFVRMDIHQGRVGYERRVHLDHRRRLLTVLIYLTDHQDAHMRGGELRLHGPRQRRWGQAKTVRPLSNRMVAFPCANDSWHSVSRLATAARPRDYIQIQLSSSVDVWPPLGRLREHLHR